MTKFVGKFRKNSNYSDDYSALKQTKGKTGRKNEHKEVKKVMYHTLREDMTEGYDYFDMEDLAA